MKRILIIMLAAAFLLTGCASSNQQKIATPEQTKEINSTSQEAEKEEHNSENDSNKLNNILSQLKDVTSINYLGKDKLFVITDQMYIIDVASGEILAQSPECDFTEGSENIYDNKENIIIVGEEPPNPNDVDKDGFYSGDDLKMLVCYYDKELNLLKKINLYKMFALDPSLASQVAVSTDGKLAIYDDNLNGLYLCNPKTKEKKEILCAKDNNKLVYDNKIGFLLGTKIAFGENDDRIIFQATCTDYPSKEGEEGVTGYGSVALDGKDLYVEKAADEYSNMDAFPEFAIFSQNCGFTSPTGKIMKYSSLNHKTEVIQLKTKEESNHLYSSSEGNILATSEENGDKGWKIRFYDTKSGKLIKEQKYNGLSSESYSISDVYIFENQNIAILFLRPLEENGKEEMYIMPL